MLVHGAAGGVGTASLQVAKGLGARTIAVVSSDEKEQVAREAGADEVVRSDGPWKDEAKELSGGGVDVVLDPVGGDRFTDSLRSLREGGRAGRRRLHRRLDPRGARSTACCSTTSRSSAPAGAPTCMGKPELNREIGAEIDRLVEAGFVSPIVGARFAARATRREALKADRRAPRDRQGRARALRVKRGGVEVVEQADRLGLAALGQPDRAAGPVRVRRRHAVQEHRLVDPRAGVGDPRHALRAAPLAQRRRRPAVRSDGRARTPPSRRRTPSRWTTRARAGMLARRICAPSARCANGAMRRPSARRGLLGIVAARSSSASSSVSSASGRGSHRVSSASTRVADGPPS